MIEYATHIEMDMNFEYLSKIISSIGRINEYKEPQYITKIKHGVEGDALLSSGYIRQITKNITTMRVNTDVEGLCFNYYSSNAHLSEHELNIFNKDKEKFEAQEEV